eukprot:RCo008271
MGAQLPKPVTSKVLERFGNVHYSCGVAQMNGYRERMEDAHSACFGPNYAFFAVFDGHMDPHCSAWLGREFPEAIAKKGPPISDDDLVNLTVDLDNRYLAGNVDSGSTGTFFIATPDEPTPEGEAQFEIQVGNVGDSRVILGRKGRAVPLTTDHKPSLEGERARIELCGGTVTNARVDGNLAVSRAFGDGQYKGGSGSPTVQKVIAVPEVRHIKARTGDFILLSCDGVFEGNFSNDEVIEFAANLMKTESDLAIVAAAVCDQALERGSKDNITCMIVEFKDGTRLPGAAEEFVPGPYSAPHHNGFRSAYAAMAEKVHLTLAQALERRYDHLKGLLAKRAAQLGYDPLDATAEPNYEKLSRSDLQSILQSYKEVTLGLSLEDMVQKCKQLKLDGKPLIPADMKEVTDELTTYGDGPEADLSGEARTAWFETHAKSMETADTDSNDGDTDTNKMVVDAGTFAKLQAVQQQSGGAIPLHLLMQLLQASAGGKSADDDI